MSAISAPLPISIGITSIADRHQPPRQPQRKAAPKAKPVAPTASPLEAYDLSTGFTSAEMADDDQGLPADTLFTVALLANSLPIRSATPDEVMLRMSHEWVPPDSDFQLTDKTI